MNWIEINNAAQLHDLQEMSGEKDVLIFKHSTRCPVSSIARQRLESQWSQLEGMEVAPYYLDLITYRAISNQVAEDFGVRHESPQILLIRDGQCVYSASHLGISVDEIKQQLTASSH